MGNLRQKYTDEELIMNKPITPDKAYPKVSFKEVKGDLIMEKIYLVFTSYGQYDDTTEMVQFATFNNLTAQNWVEEYNANLLNREAELREKEEDYSATQDELSELYELQDSGIAWVEETEVRL